MSAVLRGLPPVPPPSVDPLLDAAAACFARFGVRRTSVQDIAKVLGVNRTTVYRQAGNVEQIAMLLAVRDTHRTLAALPARISGPIGPRSLVELTAAAIAEARAHPVLAKMLADERDIIGTMVAGDAPEMLGQITRAITPLIAKAVQDGQLAPRDPVILAEWLVRIAASLILLEPLDGDEAFLAEVLIPALEP